jgi:hypothetical protein
MGISNKRRRMRNTEVAPLTLEELMRDRDARGVFDYLGGMRADNPEDAVGIMTVSEYLKMPLSKINYAMQRLRASGLADDDSGFLYLTPERGMNVYRGLRELERAVTPPADKA